MQRNTPESIGDEAIALDIDKRIMYMDGEDPIEMIDSISPA